LLRDYSAPVLMTIEGQTDADLLFILEHDTDAFNRYEAGQVLAKKLLLSLYQHAHASASSGQTLAEKLHAAGGVSSDLIGAFRTLLKDAKVDGAFKAFAISLPTDSELLVSLPEADPLLLYGVRTFVLEQIAIALQDEFRAAVAANDDAASTPYEFTAPACARRALKNKALGYLATLCDAGVTADLTSRVASAANMTDEFAAVAALDLAASSTAHTEVQLRARQQALDAFATKWASNSLVMLKWLTVQATSNTAGNVAALRQLMRDTSKFTITNPNSCYSLLLAFGRSAVNFHAADGSGYAFMGDAVLEVDKVNHQVASRLVSAFTTWRNFDSSRQQLMRAQLQRIVDTPGLSENVFEIASKSLQ
jgi:aminopeptidase N